MSNAKDLKKSYDSAAVQRRDFVKVEKNLSTLGFFTPSKSRGKVDLVEKTIRLCLVERRRWRISGIAVARRPRSKNGARNKPESFQPQMNTDACR